MKILKTYNNFINEELKHLPPPSDEETDDALLKLSPNKLLLTACEHNLMKYVKIALHNLADVDTIDSDYTTPLMFASKNGNLELIKLLMKFYPDYKATDIDGYNVLFYAIQSGNLDTVKYWIEEYHIDINFQDHYKNNALIIAIAVKNKEIFKYLIDKGININHKDKFGDTALYYAKLLNNQRDDSEVQNDKELSEFFVNYLIKHGAKE